MISRTTRTDIIRICMIWVPVSAVMEVLIYLVAPDFPGRHSTQGVITAGAFVFLMKMTVPILLLVMLIIAYSAIRFRVADDDIAPSESQYRSGRSFPFTWVAISTVLNLLFIFYPGIAGLQLIWNATANAANPLEVDVTAKQWEWDFAYPDQKLADMRTLVVPVGRPVRFVLKSDDVMHSFWVPAWGIKKAVIPGETRTLVVTPDEIMDTVKDPMTRVQCSQICGAGHADMQARVQVVSKADFSEWAKKQRAAAKEEGGGMKMNMGGGTMKNGGGMNMDMGGGNGGMMKNGGTGGMKMQSGGKSSGSGSSGNSTMPSENSGSMDMKPAAKGGGMEMDMGGKN